MKTQLSKPSRRKARYSEEYEHEALQLWRNSGHSAAKVAVERDGYMIFAISLRGTSTKAIFKG